MNSLAQDMADSLARDMAGGLIALTLRRSQSGAAGPQPVAPRERALLVASIIAALLRSPPVRAAYGGLAAAVHDLYLELLERRRGLCPRASTTLACQHLVAAEELDAGDPAAARRAVGEEFARHCVGTPHPELVERGQAEAAGALAAACTFLEFHNALGRATPVPRSETAGG